MKALPSSSVPVWKIVIVIVGIFFFLLLGAVAYVTKGDASLSSIEPSSIANTEITELSEESALPAPSTHTPDFDRETLLQIPGLVGKYNQLQDDLKDSIHQIELLRKSNEFLASKIEFIEKDIELKLSDSTEVNTTKFEGLHTSLNRAIDKIESLSGLTKTTKKEKKTNKPIVKAAQSKPDFNLFGIVVLDNILTAHIRNGVNTTSLQIDESINGWVLLNFDGLDCVVFSKSNVNSRLCHE